MIIAVLCRRGEQRQRGRRLPYPRTIERYGPEPRLGDHRQLVIATSITTGESMDEQHQRIGALRPRSGSSSRCAATTWWLTGQRLCEGPAPHLLFGRITGPCTQTGPIAPRRFPTWKMPVVPIGRPPDGLTEPSAVTVAKLRVGPIGAIQITDSVAVSSSIWPVLRHWPR